jgi:S1-C subfamily serine protease
MIRSAAAILILILTPAALAQSPQPAQPAVANQASVPWAVSVVHTIELQRVVDLIREQKLRVGVAGTAPRYMYNITTGIIVDGQGHVVTRLTNLDPQEKEHKLAVTTSDGTTLPAKLIGIDFATGFAVLEVASLNTAKPNIAPSGSLLNGATVKILSSDVVSRSVTDKVYLSPSITVSQGRVLVDSIYSRARGALTLLSDSLLARRDSSVVVTPDNQVVGIAQYAGFGRAYLYPIEFIRDTIARRVIEKRDNVPAGWLGLKGDSVAQLSDGDAGALGLQRKAGVIVRQVTPESAAAQAGIMLSDIITRVDDFDIAGTADLKALLSSLPAGQPVKLLAIRNHELVELKAVLGPRPNNEPEYLLAPFDHSTESAAAERDQLEKRFEELKAKYQSYKNTPPSRETAEAVRELTLEIRQTLDSLRALESANASQLPARPVQRDSQIGGGNVTVEPPAADISFPAGFTVRDLTPQLSAMLEARGGVLVSGVVKGSAADRGGLKTGDVIVGIQERVLVRAAQLQALLSTQHGAVALKVVRHKQPVVVNLNLQ